MAKLTGLTKRPRSSNWQVRIKVPADLQALYGRAEITRSLRTPNRQEAEVRWYQVTGEIRDELDRKREELRRRMLTEPRPDAIRRVRRRTVSMPDRPQGKPLTIQSATELARRWFREGLAKRCVAAPHDHDEAIAETRSMLAYFSNADDGGVLARTQSAAHQLLHDHGYGGCVGEPAFDHLTELLRQAMFEMEKLDLQRLETGSDDAIRSTLFGPSHFREVIEPGSVGAMTDGQTTVGEALDRYVPETWDDRSNSDRRDAKKIHRWTGTIREFFGSDTALESIEPIKVDAFFKLVKRQPVHKQVRYPGFSLEDAALAAEKDGAKTFAYETAERYRRELKRFFDWCRLQGIVSKDPAAVVKPPKRKPGDKEKRVPFKIDELQRMFSTLLYVGCLNDGRGFNRPGTERPRRGRFWVPLLGLFTGARAGELCQLRVENFKRTKSGTDYFVIRSDGEGMSVKNKNALRDVPIHSELVRLGLLEFVNERHRTGQSNLFPEMLADGNAPSKLFSSRFSSFMKSVKLKREGLTFHSFRHTARQALRRADLFREAGHRADEHIDDAFGWSKGQGMASRYGEDWPVDELAKLAELIEYPDLDLSHLYPSVSEAVREPGDRLDGEK